MFLHSVRVRIFRRWNELANPKNLESAFVFTVFFLRTAGLFPYAQGENGFEISNSALAITLIHFSVYLYVNAGLLLNDPMALAKPIIMDSDLGIAANLAIRVMGMVISVTVFMCTFTGIKGVTVVLNRYIVMLDLMAELGIETNRIFKKMFLTSTASSVVIFLISIYLLAHTYFFYEKIANEKAAMKYFYIVVVANYYQNVCMFAMGSYLYSTYLILKLCNGLLMDLLDRQMQECEVWCRQFRKKLV